MNERQLCLHVTDNLEKKLYKILYLGTLSRRA